MTFFDTVTLAEYLCVVVILAVFGWNRCHLVYLYWRHGSD
jgi:hypothetical protein